jgi:hypothetical protein
MFIFRAIEHYNGMRMGYGMYGRGRGLGMGRGLGRGFGMGMGGGMGLGPNLSASCRWFPQSPRGWLNSPSYSPQMSARASAPDLMGQPNPGMYYPQLPSPMLQQQSFLAQQIPYRSGMAPFGGMGRGRGMGLGGGFGMGYRRRFGQFSGGIY